MSRTSVNYPVFVPRLGTRFFILVGVVVTARRGGQVPGCRLGPPVNVNKRPGRANAGRNVGAHIA